MLMIDDADSNCERAMSLRPRPLIQEDLVWQ